LVLVVEAGWG